MVAAQRFQFLNITKFTNIQHGRRHTLNGVRTLRAIVQQHQYCRIMNFHSHWEPRITGGHRYTLLMAFAMG